MKDYIYTQMLIKYAEIDIQDPAAFQLFCSDLTALTPAAKEFILWNRIETGTKFN
jgi:hypothetical protein